MGWGGVGCVVVVMAIIYDRKAPSSSNGTLGSVGRGSPLHWLHFVVEHIFFSIKNKLFWERVPGPPLIRY